MMPAETPVSLCSERQNQEVETIRSLQDIVHRRSSLILPKNVGAYILFEVWHVEQQS